METPLAATPCTSVEGMHSNGTSVISFHMVHDEDDNIAMHWIGLLVHLLDVPEHHGLAGVLNLPDEPHQQVPCALCPPVTGTWRGANQAWHKLLV